MAEPMTLFEFLRDLLANEQSRDLYAQDPGAALRNYGLDNLSPADVRDALVLIEDNQTADFDRGYNTGHNDTQFASLPPVPLHHDGGEHDAAVDYLSRYITNTYVAGGDDFKDDFRNGDFRNDDYRDDYRDDDFRFRGNFDRDVDLDSATASGDGAVGAGDDISGSSIVSGDDNQVGRGNFSGNENVIGTNNDVIEGDGNTVAFGIGDANKSSFDDVNVSRGGALSVGNTATGDYDVNDSFNELNSTIRNSAEFDGSFNDETDNASDSFNEFRADTDVDSHDSVHTDDRSHNALDVDD
ncbi:IniB N-terminal domain-containing protein [Pseudonocardia xinjiangensis]|uniref:Uncharacterized protein n=1 Tax=Pseudonocardia xinjiangensis TaxID=75289 RepID=A0ABX1RM31_9PSEU|nr:IniB N-terminal domain-containing protein [Pseudonocardia xinjiangensis]NMH80856.1 hypothetical protein [Pseudonocardia xinjiangensis]